MKWGKASPRAAPRLASWSDQSLASIGVSRVSERLEPLLGSRWHTPLAPPGSGSLALADVSVDVRTVGPLATRRTVCVLTSDLCVRLELGCGLELGVGMPKWLRSGRAFSGD